MFKLQTYHPFLEFSSVLSPIWTNIPKPSLFSKYKFIIHFWNFQFFVIDPDHRHEPSLLLQITSFHPLMQITNVLHLIQIINPDHPYPSKLQIYVAGPNPYHQPPFFASKNFWLPLTTSPPTLYSFMLTILITNFYNIFRRNITFHQQLIGQFHNLA